MNNEELIAEAGKLLPEFRRVQLSEGQYFEDDALAKLDAAGYYAVYIANLLADALERTEKSLGYYKTLPHVSVYTRLEKERDEARAQLREAEATIERARGWADRPVAGFTAENQMAEVADALSTYRTEQESR